MVLHELVHTRSLSKVFLEEEKVVELILPDFKSYSKTSLFKRRWFGKMIDAKSKEKQRGGPWDKPGGETPQW